MPFTTTNYKILIASPSDVNAERQIIKNSIFEWNMLNSEHHSISFVPVMWELNVVPDLGDRTQEIINEQIVDNCDFLIGFFWNRLGCPTGKENSGTVEEINKIIKNGKRAIIYFYNKHANPNSIDLAQLSKLRAFKNDLYSKGVVGSIDNELELSTTITNHLNSIARSLPKSTSIAVDKENNILPKKDNLNIDKVVNSTIQDNENYNDIENFNSSTSFFNYRLGKAFPGVRGLQWFNNPVECVERLSILLKKPLRHTHLAPIWWFRGSSCNSIEDFQVISNDKIILDSKECKIRRVATFNSNDYYRSFLYVEFHPEEQIGIYPKLTTSQIKESLSIFGYASEEYAVFQNNIIKRTEYDDGAAIINNKIVDIDKAEIRIRYLTPYNIIICAQFNPFNSSEGDKLTEKYLIGILNENKTLENLIEESRYLPKYTPIQP